ncbi:MAG TPA: amidohydrolase family protein [Acidimicrobiia bacterium]|nr:amidohydrolase family protein [Acidimicrobiia bacterium]
MNARPFQVDTHVHVIAPDEDRYPLNPSGVTAPWYRQDPCSVERLLDLMGVAGVDAAVLVQGISAYRFDNRYTLDAAREHPEQCTSVVCVDLGGSAPASDAEALLDGGARGLRWVALHDGGLAEPRAVWDVVAARPVPVVVTILEQHLPLLADAVPHLPPVPLALDHCGFADCSAGLPESLTALAAFPTVHLKVSTIALDSAGAHGDVREFVSDLVACFGASRLLWGSDYSQTHDRPYPELAEYARFAASALPDADQAALLGGTAVTLWPELR